MEGIRKAAPAAGREEPDKEALLTLYVKARWSPKRIADKYQMEVSRVYRLLHQYGIARPPGPDDPSDYFWRQR